jgi:hypothetical protein
MICNNLLKPQSIDTGESTMAERSKDWFAQIQSRDAINCAGEILEFVRSQMA